MYVCMTQKQAKMIDWHEEKKNHRRIQTSEPKEKETTSFWREISVKLDGTFTKT